MKSINIGGIVIHYNENQEIEVQKAKEFVNKNNFLFKNLDKASVEINIDDFYSLVYEIIKEIIEEAGIKETFMQPDFLPGCYLCLLVRNGPKENGTLIQLNDSVTEEMLYFMIALKFYHWNAEKILNFLRNNNEEEKKQIMEWLRNSQRFSVYNHLLDITLKNLELNDFSMFENLDMVIKAINQESFNYARSLSNKEKQDLNLRRLSSLEFDTLFKDFLNYIHAPREWNESYDYLKENRFISFKFNQNVDKGSCYVDKKDNIRKINLESDGTIRTFIAFVHEFMHYVSLEKSVPPVSLEEFPSIYYENIVAKYLISVGFDKQILNEVIQKRKCGNFDIYSSQLSLLLDLCRYKNNGPIKREDVICLLEEQKIVVNKTMMEISKNLEKIGQDTSDFLLGIQEYDSSKRADEECDRNIDKFVNLGLLVLDGYQYLVGSILADSILESNDDDTSIKMITVTNHLGDYTISSIIDYFGISKFNDVLTHKHLAREKNKKTNNNINFSND